MNNLEHARVDMQVIESIRPFHYASESVYLNCWIGAPVFHDINFQLDRLSLATSSGVLATLFSSPSISEPLISPSSSY